MVVQLPSVVPSATAWHVPNKPATLQELQSKQELDPQQIESTQNVLAHSEPAAHAVPFVFLQLPAKQAEPVAVQAPSVVPSGTAWQVPNEPAMLQELQSAQELDPQQTPSTHVNCVSQSVVTVQESPLADLSPQWWVMVLQVIVPEQSLLLLHRLRQSEEPQT